MALKRRFKDLGFGIVISLESGGLCAECVASLREEAMFLLFPPLLSLLTHLGTTKPNSLPSTTHSSFSFLFFFPPFSIYSSHLISSIQIF